MKAVLGAIDGDNRSIEMISVVGCVVSVGMKIGPGGRSAQMQDDVRPIAGRRDRETGNESIGGDSQAGGAMHNVGLQVLKLLGPPSFAPLSFENCVVIAETDPKTRSDGCSYGCRDLSVDTGPRSAGCIYFAPTSRVHVR